MGVPQGELQEITVELVKRPGHEKVRTLIHRVLTQGLGARSGDIDFEKPIPEVRGRIDAVLGRTVFEFKSNLQRERSDALEQLTRYLSQRESETKDRFVGIATDGCDYEVLTLRDGELVRIAQHRLNSERASAWVAWLDGVVAVREQVDPTPEEIQNDLGRESVAYYHAADSLRRLWREVGSHPEARLKFDLWRQLLHDAYWFETGDEELFIQHTYLTIVAKTISTLVLHETLPQHARDILAGSVFRDRGINGGVEHDFFSWVLRHPHGEDLVWRIARQADRFRLRDVETDILRSLYESLIDPEQRHDLGEYYTPDWLASRICDEVIDDPLEQRVLDPSCGSGTFLFHALRKALAAAERSGLSADKALAHACRHVVGVDIHPVATVLAGTTCVLALQQHLRKRRGASPVNIPVYIGDSLQWNVHDLHDRQQVVIRVPKRETDPEGTVGPELFFPAEVARDPAIFDLIIDEMQRHARRDDSPESFAAWMGRQHDIPVDSRPDLRSAYEVLLGLYREGRNDVWPFVAKHLSRPLWLSLPQHRVDRIVGNPPWVAYRHMSRGKQIEFRERCKRLGLWVGGKVATNQDLSAYFFARAVELYLKPGGRIGMVMPFAAMTREAYRGFRTGRYPQKGAALAAQSFTSAWTFQSDLQPLFKTASCTLFAKEGRSDVLPARVVSFKGELPRRDASPEEARASITEIQVPWPAESTIALSEYGGDFRQGATLVPRRFIVVEPVPGGKLGMNPAAPLVRGRTGSQDKAPWKSLEPWEAPIENEFLRPICLGESIAPFRLLHSALGVIPWFDRLEYLLNSSEASRRGFPHLAAWLKRSERLWAEHGTNRMTYRERIDYNRGIRSQVSGWPTRVLYAGSGTMPAAAVLSDPSAIVEHGVYWASVKTTDEADYLVAILNSEALRQRISDLQSQGQWGARHFDKYVFGAPIPRYDPTIKVHAELARSAKYATKIAKRLPVDPDTYFVSARRQIRELLTEDGISNTIENLVDDLLRKAESRRLSHPPTVSQKSGTRPRKLKPA